MKLVAVDLGASSGRVMLADVAAGRLELDELHRFPNTPRQAGGHLRWDVHALHDGVLEGIAAACRVAGPAGIGIDSWAVDYGLLDERGELLGDPVCYRDGRTEGVVERIHRHVPAAELYAVTGLQQLPFNTLVQLAAEPAGTLAAARTMLLVPDLLTYWLTGVLGAERTNASTTQLYDVRTGGWASDLLDRLGLPAGLLPPLREPGDVVPLLPAVREKLGAAAGLGVVAVGSHDTASAVVGVPMADEHAAYISSGTWSLVGLELPAPVLCEAGRLAGFTNEGGVDGTVRYLRNVMGLWLLQESMRSWASSGRPVELATVLAEAARLPRLARVIDPDHPTLLPPGDQPARIAALCRATGQAEPSSPAETVRTILDSLALAYRRTVREACDLAGREVRVVHVVGGGARNELLCQLTADACRVPVLAGPVEAAALGNALVQARALGALSGGLAELRSLVRDTHRLVRYEPSGDDASWDRAEALTGRHA